ncbi:MAG: pyridoxal 5'-phosphate synthase glutaminase subunit PdxT [Candidatus Diapherotrites archaeon]|nr:pyridoxal 5'-phosphate synthase glutaminase subunit PdxT [Candidatus Diapherotrites archaeon]
MLVGVLAVQGAIAEHVQALEKAGASALKVENRQALERVDALVIPGGESTTIGRLIGEYGLYTAIRKRAAAGMPIMGTCAGLILLAKEGDKDVQRTNQKLLGLMDTRIARNAFGGQRESFEAMLEIPVIGRKKFRGVFIRAPTIEKAGEGVEVISRFEDRIVAARQGSLLALSFHPELTADTRLHKYFLGMI